MGFCSKGSYDTMPLNSMPFSELMGSAMQDADEAAERYLIEGGKLQRANEPDPHSIETEKSANP
jgi:hypothetical protein